MPSSVQFYSLECHFTLRISAFLPCSLYGFPLPLCGEREKKKIACSDGNYRDFHHLMQPCSPHVPYHIAERFLLRTHSAHSQTLGRFKLILILLQKKKSYYSFNYFCWFGFLFVCLFVCLFVYCRELKQVLNSLKWPQVSVS